MTPAARQYQTTLKHDIYNAWNSGMNNVMAVLSTGGGKTFVGSEMFNEHRGEAVAMAHRKELVGQLSLALANQGVYHNIIAAQSTVKFIANQHVHELKKSFFHPQAPITVAGVKTLLRRDLGQWRHQVTMWMQDEAHHVLQGNEWGKAA